MKTKTNIEEGDKWKYRDRLNMVDGNKAKT